jgi:SAM-dependent methyltransferase
MKLHLGCGNDYREGYVNVDMGDCKCDLKHDISVIPWPFEDDFFDGILALHVLEHLPKEHFPEYVREMRRVCKNGAFWEIKVPEAGSNNFWTDPTHTMPYTIRSFDFFDKKKPLHENGMIYGWGDIDIFVNEATLIPSPPNGPDIRFLIKVNK